jgi:2'-5' RNA ligase
VQLRGKPGFAAAGKYDRFRARAMLASCAMARPGSPSALIVEVPEAEAAVARHRERLDANAALGVPAHFTVLFPFMPSEAIGPPVLSQLEDLFAAFGGFRFELVRTAWFGDEVLWLAPRDPAPFRSLTGRVQEAFPAFPPFEGQYDDVVPHLTVGHGHPPADLRAAGESVRAHLPIEARAAAVTLMTQSAGGQWARGARFPLA